MVNVTQKMIAAAWATWRSRHGDKLGPGPAFKEAIAAALKAQDNVVPWGAYTVDYLGCEHCGTIDRIKEIAAAGSKGPTEVIYLYAGQPPIGELAHETSSPPGSQIRTAECDGKDAVPATGQLPVGTASTQPTDLEKMRSALNAAVATIQDYLAYDHDGDPSTEDSRSMGEMDINDYGRDGRLAYALELLSNPSPVTHVNAVKIARDFGEEELRGTSDFIRGAAYASESIALAIEDAIRQAPSPQTREEGVSK